jgi:hypothetical protein
VTKKESEDSGIETSPDPQDLEKMKLLYEFAKEGFKEQDNRWNGIDDKAAKFIPVIGLMLGGAGFFGNWLMEKKLIPPQNTLDWLALACTLVVFMTILCSWVQILRVLKVRACKIISIEDDTVDYFCSKNLRTIYIGYANRFLREAKINKNIVDVKLKGLIYAYYGIVVTAFLLVLLLFLVGGHNWLNSKQVTNWNALRQLLDGGFLLH